MSVSLATQFTEPITQPLLVQLRPALELSDDQFFALAQLNRELRLERTQYGDLLMMPPAGGGSGHRNANITVQLGVWARRDKSGVTFDSSTGFRLPNGAIRSPDGAWLKRQRWEGLTDAEREKYPPLCPDFVIELRSPTDSLERLQAKLDEYLANGAKLGWLIDPSAKRVLVYQAGSEPREVAGAVKISADPVLPGFELDLSEIW